MKDNESIKVGDKLMCISNTGLSSIGDMTTIWGLTATSINTSGSTTGWGLRKDFRWSNFNHYPCDSVSDDIIKFNDKVKSIADGNKKLLSELAVRLQGRNVI